ncbi:MULTISPECIES: hypothetical protein [unclassified Pseudomonas]|uniref:hypothetical protein n=1 Tax=unclassified Pseudomonas TaxID=196821 RepID=UPI00131E4D98|nr:MULTISPECIES: hypothetical protein [unclassified Pseudomonas]
MQLASGPSVFEIPLRPDDLVLTLHHVAIVTPNVTVLRLVEERTPSSFLLLPFLSAAHGVRSSAVSLLAPELSLSLACCLQLCLLLK